MEVTQDAIRQAIIDECNSIRDLLLEKNESYGNSVFDPIGIFSKGDPEEQICIRLDDKLKRLQRGKEFQGDDTVKDLIGYLHLLRIWRRLRDMPPPLRSGVDEPEEVKIVFRAEKDLPHWKEKEVK